jgi:hypothetical protein
MDVLDTGIAVAGCVPGVGMAGAVGLKVAVGGVAVFATKRIVAKKLAGNKRFFEKEVSALTPTVTDDVKVSLKKELPELATISGTHDLPTAPHPGVSEPYVRPLGTTRAQRKSVQGSPCVDCGKTAAVQRADHKDPLVVQYYRDGSIDLEKAKSLDAVQAQCPDCSNKQGGTLSAFSGRMKKLLP